MSTEGESHPPALGAPPFAFQLCSFTPVPCFCLLWRCVFISPLPSISFCLGRVRGVVPEREESLTLSPAPGW